MTKDEIMALEAGRELDALIAERVMGLKLFTATPKHTAIAGGCKVSNRTWVDTGEMHEWGPVVKYLSHYSTDVVCAWEVVEKFRANGGLVELEGCKFWIARVTFKYCKEAPADTAPLAICRAALTVSDIGKE